MRINAMVITNLWLSQIDLIQTVLETASFRR